jgi:prepilin-type processing-associated H-X9-DG protein
MSEPIHFRRTHPAALASLLLGLCSLVLGLLTGLPALWLGLRGLRAVNAGDGQMRGARLAVAGMVLGALGTFVTLLGLGAVVAIQLRYNSNRVECVNNLRQIGLALNKYADTHKRFPAATRDPRRLTPDHRLSWMADVVPLLAEGTPKAPRYLDLARKIDRTKGWDDPANAAALATPVRLFLCPGHPRFEPYRSPGLTHYVGIAGIDPDAADLPRDNPRAGMFGNNRGVSRRRVERGISFTMMVIETTADNGPWLAGGHPTVRGLAPDEEHYIGPGRPFGGMHQGLANVLWVDGGVRPVSEKIPPEVFRAQATLREPEEGKEK